MIPPVICKKEAVYLPDPSSCGANCFEKIMSIDYLIQPDDVSSTITQIDEFNISTTEDFIKNHYYIFDVQRKDTSISGDAYFGSRNFTQIFSDMAYQNPTFAGLSFTRQQGQIIVYPTTFWINKMDGIGIFPSALPPFQTSSGINIPIQILKKYELPYTVNWGGEYTLSVYAVCTSEIEEEPVQDLVKVMIMNGSASTLEFNHTVNGVTITETIVANQSVTIEVPVGTEFSYPENFSVRTDGSITYNSDTHTGVINGSGTITFTTVS